MLLQSTRLLELLFYLYWTMQAVSGILTLRRTFLLWRNSRIAVLDGFVGADLSHSNTWSKSSSDCCRELSWPSLSNRLKYLSVATMYDMLHHHISLDFFNFFTLSSYPTRSHSLSILCKQSSINSFRYCFFVNSICFWNCIPLNILSVPHRSSFKYRL